MSVALSLHGVVKSFGPTRALDGLDLEARHGEVHGFLGPNGAGKTVTIRVKATFAAGGTTVPA